MEDIKRVATIVINKSVLKSVIANNHSSNDHIYHQLCELPNTGHVSFSAKIIQILPIRERVIIHVCDGSTCHSMRYNHHHNVHYIACICWDNRAQDANGLTIGDLIRINNAQVKKDNMGYMEVMVRNSSTITKTGHSAPCTTSTIHTMPLDKQTGFFYIQGRMTQFTPDNVMRSIVIQCTTCGWCPINELFQCQHCDTLAEYARYSYCFWITVNQRHILVNGEDAAIFFDMVPSCLLYTSPSPRD